MKKLLPLLALSLLFTACTQSGQVSSEDFEIPEGPSLHEVSYEEAPLYFYLFTHTEDHFNHELSEDRYWRGGAMLEALYEKNPDLDITWTIEFQGADAQTVAERNEQTGLVDYLMELNEKGLVEFGYHAHHDPTYNNRPQKQLPENPTWDEVYEAISTWVSCEKDPLRGGCVAETGGGLLAVLDAFGQVEVVSGVGLTDGALIERSAGSQAIKDLLPDHWLGFGFPDHGGTIEEDNYIETRDALMALLSPTADTSSGTLWMDNSIRINDGAALQGSDSIPLKEGAETTQTAVESLDRSRPILLNVGFVDKYVYTRRGTSPTKWGYANADEPELPDKYLNSPERIDQYYQAIEEALDAILKYDATFVNSDEAVELFVSEEYWEVTEEELIQMSHWILNEWDETPPAYAYDGLNYYSLTDFAFLALAHYQGESLDGIVSEKIGPWSRNVAATDELSLQTQDLYEWMSRVSLDAAFPESLTVGKTELSSAQVLYALAMVTAAQAQNTELSEITIPATQTAPASYDLLETLGCIDCLDTSWSLKPARFQD